jgi:hypothetical protein
MAPLLPKNSFALTREFVASTLDRSTSREPSGKAQSANMTRNNPSANPSQCRGISEPNIGRTVPVSRPPKNSIPAKPGHPVARRSSTSNGKDPTHKTRSTHEPQIKLWKAALPPASTRFVAHCHDGECPLIETARDRVKPIIPSQTIRACIPEVCHTNAASPDRPVDLNRIAHYDSIRISGMTCSTPGQFMSRPKKPAQETIPDLA